MRRIIIISSSFCHSFLIDANMYEALALGGFRPPCFLLYKLQALLLDHGSDLSRSIWNKCVLVTVVSSKGPALKSQWQKFSDYRKRQLMCGSCRGEWWWRDRQDFQVLFSHTSGRVAEVTASVVVCVWVEGSNLTRQCYNKTNTNKGTNNINSSLTSKWWHLEIWVWKWYFFVNPGYLLLNRWQIKTSCVANIQKVQSVHSPCHCIWE